MKMQALEALTTRWIMASSSERIGMDFVALHTLSEVEYAMFSVMQRNAIERLDDARKIDAAWNDYGRDPGSLQYWTNGNTF